MKAKRNKEILVETLERITVRFRNSGQTASCSSCGRSTTWLTAEQAQQIFGLTSKPLESIHVTEDGPVRLICAHSITPRDEENEMEKPK